MSAALAPTRYGPPAIAALVAGALLFVGYAPPGGAQFTLWETISAPNPFSVTAAVRGVSPAPSIRLEGLVGYFNGASNQFAYHMTGALTATSPSTGLRVIDTTQDIFLLDQGVQSAFNGLCCSNNSIGLTDDTTLHAATNFAAGTSSEILIGIPDLTDSWSAFGDQIPPSSPLGPGRNSPDCDGDCEGCEDCEDEEGCDDVSGSSHVLEPEGTIAFRRIAVSSVSPPVTAGLEVDSIDGPAGSAWSPQLTLSDCRSVASNWHFSMDRSDALDENFVACVKTNGNLVLKRVKIDPDAVTEIPLASGVGTSSSIFAYLHTAVCPISTGSVVGTVIPRQSLGSTTFFATYLSPTGVVAGTSQVTLPGARANHQAFFCRSHGDYASFVYHGTGQAPTTTTDTFVIEAGQASLVPPAGGGKPLLVRRVTESRRTDWADAFANDLFTPAGGKIQLYYRGPQPVAEVRNETGTSNDNVRYGGIQVPLFFHNFESGDFRFFSAVVP